MHPPGVTVQFPPPCCLVSDGAGAGKTKATGLERRPA